MNKNEILLRLKEIEQLRKKLNVTLSNPIVYQPIGEVKSSFKKGISVIIPTYKGEKVISKCLDSLAKQSFSQSLFEVIIIMNGERDLTEQVVENFKKKNKMDNIVLLYSSKASASSARNIGITHANREYTVFLDDDDYISDRFLEEMYRFASLKTVVFSQIANVDKNGRIDFDNSINKQVVSAAANTKNTIQTLNMVATINACKLIPTFALKNMEYDPTLKSGEDVVFYAELFAKNDFVCMVVPIENQAVYYRVLRDDSVSRQSMTFDFNIKQRLDVISCLDRLLKQTFEMKKQTFIKQKINAQAMFINRYLKENIGEMELVQDEVKKRNLSYFPYAFVNKGLANKLIVAYCFPPYADTSGNVMAKRLRNMNEIVDVVYNKMDKVRDKDYTLNGLVEDLIDERIDVPTYPSFSNWKAIEDFCKYGLDKIDKEKNYAEVYSRAMWPGSHFLAYEYKIRNPKVKWVAEFSDPLLLDIHGNTRVAKIDNEEFIKNVNKLIKKQYKKIPPIKDNNLFFWCECLPYLFADKLIFTNEHQLKYMINTFPVKGIRKLIKRKAVISPQPTLPKEFYYKNESKYDLDVNKTNIAYFGTFYQTRNLDDLFLGLKNATDRVKEQVVLHVFTAKPEELQNDIKGSEFEKLVRVNPYVGYTEFLNLTTKFDCLVVNDANTKDSKPLNPYLPSKLSDYIGSGASVWGIYEENSVLSTYSLTYKSELGKVEQATNVFEQMVMNKNADKQLSKLA